jgi:hypothetical protein
MRLLHEGVYLLDNTSWCCRLEPGRKSRQRRKREEEEEGESFTLGCEDPESRVWSVRENKENGKDMRQKSIYELG